MLPWLLASAIGVAGLAAGYALRRPADPPEPTVTALTGGRFSLAGSVIGALIIQTLTSTIYSLGFPPEINLVVKAVLVFAVMLLKSAGFRALLTRRPGEAR